MGRLELGVLFFAAFMLCQGAALNCNTFTSNDFDKNDVEEESLPCNGNQTSCASLQYTAVLNSDGTKVQFQKGLCTTPNLCNSFCRELRLYEPITEAIPQCQAQCCTGDNCNTQIL